MVPISIIFCTLEILLIVFIAFRKHQNEYINTFLPFVLTGFCRKGHNEPGTQRLSNAETVWKGVPWGTAAEVDKQNLCWEEWQGTGKETRAEGQLRRIKSEWKQWENTTRTKGWEEVGTVWIKEKTPGLRSWTPMILYETYVVAARTGVERRSGPCWVTKENGYFQFVILTYERW